MLQLIAYLHILQENRRVEQNAEIWQENWKVFRTCKPLLDHGEKGHTSEIMGLQ